MTYTPEEARRDHAAMYHKPPAKRKGKTPEAKVAEKIDEYLEKIGFYVLRTGAGVTKFDDRYVTIGRAGTHDRTCCAPGGYFVSIEIKSKRGKARANQLRQAAFIERRGGLVIMEPRSVADVRAALVARFGEDVVRGWERNG